MVIKQQYARQYTLTELEITACHWSMTRQKRSLTGSYFLQLIHHILNLIIWLDYFLLFYGNIIILSQIPHFLKSLRKDILSKPMRQK